MPTPPASTKSSLTSRLRDHACTRWPQLDAVRVLFRAGFACVDGDLGDGETVKLCRLHYGGSASSWGFAIYCASHDDYQDAILPSGAFAGSPEQALDCVCGLYLGDPSAWADPITDTPTN
jgi:hypothetical protein